MGWSGHEAQRLDQTWQAFQAKKLELFESSGMMKAIIPKGGKIRVLNLMNHEKYLDRRYIVW